MHEEAVSRVERKQPSRLYGLAVSKAKPVVLCDMRQHHDAFGQGQRRADAKARPIAEGNVGAARLLAAALR